VSCVVNFVDRETELQLVARLKTCDPAAFEAVYEEFRPRLFSFLVRLSRRRDVAEDLLEETWLRLVRHCRDLTEDSCLAAWLFTVARHLYASWCRRLAVDDERFIDLTPSWPLAAPGETPFETAARSESERRVEVALARLPLRYRETLLMVAVQGLSPTEVASCLRLRPETLRKRLQRAREKLASEMETLASEARKKVKRVG
jgi:RNA polymerase sigma factor (sigma-70 family)